MAEDSSGTQTAEGTVQGTEGVVPAAEERQEKPHEEGELESGQPRDSLDDKVEGYRMAGRCPLACVQVSSAKFRCRKVAHVCLST